VLHGDLKVGDDSHWNCGSMQPLLMRLKLSNNCKRLGTCSHFFFNNCPLKYHWALC